MFTAEPTPLVTPARPGLTPLTAARWEPGETFVHEHGAGFRAPLRVVSDDERGLVGWLAPGSEVRAGRRSDGSSLRAGGREDHLSPRIVARTRWRGPGILRLFLPGRDYSVWFFWTEAGDFDGWYVNLETQALRGEACVVSVDQILDIWVQADGAISLKDEDELDDAVTVGRCSPHVRTVIHAHADAAITDVEARRWPFDGTYVDWRPPAGWDALPMPAGYGWDVDELA